MAQTRAPIQPRSQERYDAVLDAAEEYLLAHGAHDLKITKVAELAGVKTSSVYQYFDNADAIFEALILKYYTSVPEQILNVDVGAIDTIDDVYHLLARMIDTYVEMYQANRIYKHLWARVGLDEELEQYAREITKAAAEKVLERFEHVIPEYKLLRVKGLLTHQIHTLAANIRYIVEFPFETFEYRRRCTIIGMIAPLKELMRDSDVPPHSSSYLKLTDPVSA